MKRGIFTSQAPFYKRIPPFMKLSDTKLRSLKTPDKPTKYFDGDGLFLLVTPTGSKLWRLKYRYQGKEKGMALGKYPEISLTQARALRFSVRQTLAQGNDPAKIKAQAKADAMTFDDLATRWLERSAPTWSDATYEKRANRLANNVRPWLGPKPVGSITVQDVIDTIKRVEARGAGEMAHRVAQDLKRIFRFAVQNQWAPVNVAGDLGDILKPVRTKHHAAPTEPEQVRQLLRMLDGFTGSHVVKTALKIAPLLFVRPGELRNMEWSEIDFDKSMWKIPADKMKMRQAHLVPLSTQAIALLKDLQPLTGQSTYVFPNERTRTRPMSDAAVNAALRRMGIDTKTELTGHGFRAMARTLAHEQLGISPDVLERQLAHSVAGPLKATYNRTQFLAERIAMMQAWADYLDELCE